MCSFFFYPPFSELTLPHITQYILSLSCTCLRYTVSVDGRQPQVISPIQISVNKSVTFHWQKNEIFGEHCRFDISCTSEEGMPCPGPIYSIYARKGKERQCKGNFVLNLLSL